MQLQITNLQAFIATNGHEWRYNSQKSPLLRPFAFDVNIFRCVAPEVPFLPALVLSSQLPAVNLYVSGSMLPRLMTLALAFGDVSKASKAVPLPDQLLVTESGEYHTHALTKLDQHELWRVTEFELTRSELAKILKNEDEAQEIMKEIDKNGYVLSSKVCSHKRDVRRFNDWFDVLRCG
jgi:hypothetical protein